MTRGFRERDDAKGSFPFWFLTRDPVGKKNTLTGLTESSIEKKSKGGQGFGYD